MQTKKYIASFLLAVVYMLSLTSQLSAMSHIQKRPPNIIYINTDDWGIGKVPCYNMDPASKRIIRTPNM